MNNIINFLFEVGYLNQIKRSQLLRQNNSIAEHSFRVAVIGYVLAELGNADINKTVQMCLFHDLPETRIGDADFVNRCYSKINEKKALNDMVKKLPFGNKIKNLMKELWLGQSKEAKISRDADILEELLTEKEQYESGIKSANRWMKFSINRLITKNGKRLGRRIFNHDSNSWWHSIIKNNYLRDE